MNPLVEDFIKYIYNFFQLHLKIYYSLYTVCYCHENKIIFR